MPSQRCGRWEMPKFQSSLCFAVTSMQLCPGKGGLHASPGWGCFRQCDLAVSLPAQGTLSMPEPSWFGGSNYEVSCESPAVNLALHREVTRQIVLGRGNSCSPVFYRLWPFFLLPRGICSPLLMCSCHTGSSHGQTASGSCSLQPDVVFWAETEASEAWVGF